MIKFMSAINDKERRIRKKLRKEKIEELNRLLEKYKTIEVNNLHQTANGFITVMQADYKLNNGETINRDYILKNGKEGNSVNVLPITKEKEVLLVVQPRVSTKRTVSVEFPAGLCEKGEDPETSIRRELLEETGYTSNNFIKILTCYQDEGCSKSVENCFLALDCEKIQDQNLDSDEFIDVFKCTIDEAYELVDLSYIQGAFSIVTLERARKYLNK